jgi:hypothetical protein
MNNPILNPSGKTLSIFIIVYLIGTSLLVLASTDLFSDTMLQKKYLMTNFMIVGSTITILIQIINYLKHKE